MSYDPKIHDPETRTNMVLESLSDETVSRIFLETMRQFFMNVNNFTTHRMRERQPPLTWKEDERTGEPGVRIVRDVDWVPENMGKTPEIVIRSGGTMWKPINNDAAVDPFEETVEDPTIVSDQITGRHAIWVISPVASEARMIAWEIGSFLSAFASPLRCEYGFSVIRPAGIGNPVKIKERKGYWGVAVAIGYIWYLSQELIEVKPRLAEIVPTSEIR